MLSRYIALGVFGLACYAIQIGLFRHLRLFQPIYALSPGHHHTKKTPSFGGVSLWLIITAGIGALRLHHDHRVLWAWGVFTGFGLIGFLDDFLSAAVGKNKGLSARQKFGLQTLLATAFLGIYGYSMYPLSILSFCIFVFLMVGFSNATNLTDGLDGLLGGLSVIALIGFRHYFFHRGDIPMAHFCVVVSVALLVFLCFNRHPAKIFMGDTGSLALGALFAGFAVLASEVRILLILGGVFIIETLSVMLQVAYFKRTQKRLFLMAPLHHHYELLGLSEQNVVRLFWLVGAVFLVIFMRVYS